MEIKALLSEGHPYMCMIYSVCLSVFQSTGADSNYPAHPVEVSKTEVSELIQPKYCLLMCSE